MAASTLKTKIHGPVAIIGDVHGHTEKLATILNRLKSLADYQHRWIVLIGDLVDRGPDPRGTVDLVLKLIHDHPRTTVISGNHEFAMCSALGWLPSREGTNWGERWVKHYNSDRTFASYEAAVGDLEDLSTKVPPEHRDLLTNLPWCVEHPQLLFVHAGLNPNTQFATQLRILQQRDFSLSRPEWLCEKSFVDSEPPKDCPFTVVSGHVRVESVQIRPKRILVDTTGGDDGDLSCLLMPEKKVISSGNRSSERPTRPLSTSTTTKSSWWNLWG